MKIAAIMTRDPRTIDADASLDEAVELMDEGDLRHLPVLRGGAWAGVVSDRDLLAATGWLPGRVRAIFQDPAEIRDARVGDLLHDPAMRVAPGDDLWSVAVEVVVQRIGCLPVLEGQRLVGIVTEMDLLRAFAELRREGRLGEGQDPRARALMTPDPLTIAPDRTLADARALTSSRGVHHLPVVQEGLLVGILSDRDLLRAQGAGRRGDYPVTDLMTVEPEVIGPDGRASEAAARMVEHHVSALPVTERGRLVGILAIPDLLEPFARALADEPE